MSASVRVTRTIKRPVAEVAEVATDPEQLFAHFAGFARLMRVDDSDDDSLWDVFLDVGSYEVGSRVGSVYAVYGSLRRGSWVGLE